MSVRRLKRWLCAAALVPLLVIAVSAPLWAMHCRMMGTVGEACCCPESESTTSASTPTVSGETCCELAKYEGGAPASERPSPGARVLPPPATVLAEPWDVALRPRAEIRVARERAGPPPGPSLLLVKRSFLI